MQVGKLVILEYSRIIYLRENLSLKLGFEGRAMCYPLEEVIVIVPTSMEVNVFNPTNKT